MPAVNDVGEPCAGEPHARFDGRELETEYTLVTTAVLRSWILLYPANRFGREYPGSLVRGNAWRGGV
jgi:hypothetical protein